jgi:hypothetical protein
MLPVITNERLRIPLPQRLNNLVFVSDYVESSISDEGRILL